MADQRGINSMVGVARVALGLSLAAACRLDEALAPLQQGATTMAARGQPPELANALLCLARVLGSAGDTAGMAATLAKARSALASCPGPGNGGRQSGHARAAPSGAARIPRATSPKSCSSRSTPSTPTSGRSTGSWECPAGPTPLSGPVP